MSSCKMEQPGLVRVMVHVSLVVLTLSATEVVQGFTPSPKVSAARPSSLNPRPSRTGPFTQQQQRRPPPSSSALNANSVAHLMGQGLSLYQTVFAGSLAGAIGIFVAYPFDTIRTKQVLMNGNNNKRESGDDILGGLGSSEDGQVPFFVTSFGGSDDNSPNPAYESTTSWVVTSSPPTPSSSAASVSPRGSVSFEEWDELATAVVGDTTTTNTLATTTTTLLNPNASAIAMETATATTVLTTTTTSGPLPSASIVTTPNWLSLDQRQDDQAVTAASPTSYSIWDVIVTVTRDQGIRGFFGGVQSMMIGQAIIKALTFTVNAVALEKLPHLPVTESWSDAQILFFAAACAGFLASFVVAPIERVCVLMQAQASTSTESSPVEEANADITPDWNTAATMSLEGGDVATGTVWYANEWDCVQSLIRDEGLGGWLFGSGWTISVLREMPSDMIYFGFYGILIQHVPNFLPMALAPLIFGAIAGVASWLPIYPFDVVKTVLQSYPSQILPQTAVTSEESVTLDASGAASMTAARPSAWEIAIDMYEDKGVEAFFEGLNSKLIRAAVHHAVTFAVFDAVVQLMQQQSS